VRYILLSLVLLQPAISLAQSPSDWPNFRGPTQQGVTDAKNLPLKWGQTENIAWKVELPGPGASSPIVLGDHIYITCYSGFFVEDKPGGAQKDLQRHLLCFDKTGKPLWEKRIPAKLPEEDSIRDHGFAGNTPAADKDMVICFFGKSGVYAFDHSGNQLWQADVGDKTHGWGSAASSVIYKDLVFINASVESDSLIALDRKTGKQKWKAPKIHEAWNTPVVIENVNNKPELIIATQGSVHAYNPDNGKPLWTCATDITWYMVPSIVAHEGIIYCLGGRSGVAGLAIQSGGSGDVTKTHRLWTSQKGSNVTSPVFKDGRLYWMNDNQEMAFCADAKTGKVIYQQRVNRAGQVYASALLAGDRIYYLTRDGKTFVVAAKPTYEELAVNDLRDGSIFNATFAVDGNRLLVRSDKFLYAIE
jgi:outer membrane protein assembly factor BamB